MKNKFIIAALAFAPVMASAQTLGNLNNLLTSLGRLINSALPIVVALGLLAFFWGLVRYIFSEKKDESRDLMIWGIVAIFVMVSVWGLVRFIGNAFGIEQGGSAPVPTVDNLPR